MRWYNVQYGIRQRVHDIVGRFKITDGAVSPVLSSGDPESIQSMFMGNIKDALIASFGPYQNAGGSVIFTAQPTFGAVSAGNRPVNLPPFVGLTKSGRFVKSEAISITLPESGSYFYASAFDEMIDPKVDLCSGASEQVMACNQVITNANAALRIFASQSKPVDYLKGASIDYIYLGAHGSTQTPQDSLFYIAKPFAVTLKEFTYLKG